MTLDNWNGLSHRWNDSGCKIGAKIGPTSPISQNWSHSSPISHHMSPRLLAAFAQIKNNPRDYHFASGWIQNI